MPTITLPDGSSREFDKPVTIADIAGDIGPGLAKAALAGRVNGELVDTSHTVTDDAEIAIVTERDDDGIEVLRHSCAHLMAQAVQRLFPKAQVTIGPVVEDGFFYDFAFERPFTPEDLEAIEKTMQDIVKEDLEVQRSVMSHDLWQWDMLEMGEEYKVEILKSIPGDEQLSFYKQGEFIDLCRGPHVPSTGKFKAFKLTSVAGAYWRGDASNEMLQRILRNRLGIQERPWLVPAAPGRSREAGSPQAGQAAAAIPLSGRSPGYAVLASEGLDAVPDHPGLHAGKAACA